MMDDAAATSPSATELEIASVITDVLRRRDAGDLVPDHQVIDAHPHLMPELRDHLKAIYDVRRAFAIAHRARSVLEPIRILDDAELEAPIELSEEPALTSFAYTPIIPGYIVLGELGSGGQAAVFKARHHRTGRLVAVKVMLGGSAAGSTNRERFDREIAVLAKLDHPNIVGVIDCGQTADGSSFFAMAYVDGRPLDEYVHALVDRDGDLSAVIRLFSKVARAVNEAHNLGIVHRDLKPSNILVDESGEPHVLDFGLAHLAASSLISAASNCRTLVGQVIGSLPWASPEQANGEIEAMGPPSDIYSLGVLCYEVLTRTFPYPVTGSVTEIVRNITTLLPAAPSSFILVRRRSRSGTRRVLSMQGDNRLDTLDAVLLKALAKKPGDRYSNAGLLADDFEAYLCSRPTSARVRKGRRVAGRWLVLTTLLLCAAGVWVGWSRIDRSRATYPVITLPEITNRYGMRFVKISPRTFVMGSLANEVGFNPEESRRTVVLTEPYFIGVSEVTQRQYREVMGVNPSDPRFLDDSFPVNCVSWDDAQAFCRRLSALDGRHYRLPTESEWECACRAGSAFAYAGTGKLDDMGWFAENSQYRLHTTMSKLPNEWGLFDMHGGVAEWCEDPYTPNLPKDLNRSATNPLQDSEAVHRVIRGGSFLSGKNACRTAARGNFSQTARATSIGFRIVSSETPVNHVSGK